MELDDLLRHRRMVRAYQDRPVEPATVDRILDRARRAPSAGFSQGQTFVVVTDADRRAAIAEAAGEADFVARGFPPWLSRAPVHIVPCADERAYRRRYAAEDKLGPDGQLDWRVPYWHVDVGASLMLLLLAVTDEGLAAGFQGVHNIPGLAGLLGTPAGVHPIGVVTVGHADRDTDPGSSSRRRGRRPLSEVVHRERWGR